jgi:hypothetical protein
MRPRIDPFDNQTFKKPLVKDLKGRYTSPRLVVYGDLARLTMNKSGTKADGTGHPSTKAGNS